MHRGVDIAPVRREAERRPVRLVFTRLPSGEEYPAEVPGWVPEDEVFVVADGVVSEAVTQESDSDFGLHVVLRHTWPRSRAQFFTLYAHLASVQVTASGRRYARVPGWADWAPRAASRRPATGWPPFRTCILRRATRSTAATIRWISCGGILPIQKNPTTVPGHRSLGDGSSVTSVNLCGFSYSNSTR
jgi:hypothetical protein